MVHAGGRTSKLSRDLANIRLQLKHKKTRSANPRELEQDEIDALIERRDGLLLELRSAAKERAAPQHKTSVVVCAVFDRVIFYSQSILRYHVGR